MNLDKLREELIRDEGKRLEAYRDSRGYWTIGIGHLLGSTPRMSSITEEECEALFTVDVREATDVCRRVFGATLLTPMWAEWNDARMRALVNMAFNRGEGHMRESTTITPAIRAALGSDYNNWKAVADAIKASPWATQVGARAARLAKMFDTGMDS